MQDFAIGVIPFIFFLQFPGISHDALRGPVPQWVWTVDRAHCQTECISYTQQRVSIRKMPEVTSHSVTVQRKPFLCICQVLSQFHKHGSQTVMKASYSAANVSQNQDHQQCFTILEVAADSHELITLQCIMWPSIARSSKPLDRGAAHRHTTAP